MIEVLDETMVHPATCFIGNEDVSLEKSAAAALSLNFDLVYKAGGVKLPAGRGIASVVRDIFRRQEQVLNPATFRQHDTTLAQALLSPLLRVMLTAAKEQNKLAAKDLEPDLLASAKARCIETAGSVNATTLELANDGAPSTFSTERAASIGLTEANWGANTARGLAAQAQGKQYLVWRAYNKACPLCKHLDGKRVKIGKGFKLKDGSTVPTPPAHPHCRCAVEAE